MQTREQRYAQDVYNRVSAITSDEKLNRKKYGSMAHKLPILIRTAGLAQALTFVEARGDKSGSQYQLLRDLGATVGHGDKLAADARSVELGEYLRLTQQVLDALLWYKRFVQSVLGVEPGEDEEDERND